MLQPLQLAVRAAQGLATAASAATKRTKRAPASAGAPLAAPTGPACARGSTAQPGLASARCC